MASTVAVLVLLSACLFTVTVGKLVGLLQKTKEPPLDLFLGGLPIDK